MAFAKWIGSRNPKFTNTFRWSTSKTSPSPRTWLWLISNHNILFFHIHVAVDFIEFCSSSQSFLPYLNFADRDLGLSFSSLSSASMIRLASTWYRVCFSASFRKLVSSRLEENWSGRKMIPWKCRLIMRSSKEWKLMHNKVPPGFNSLKTQINKDAFLVAVGTRGDHLEEKSLLRLLSRLQSIPTDRLVRGHCRVRSTRHWQRFSALETFWSLDVQADWVYRHRTRYDKDAKNTPRLLMTRTSLEFTFLSNQS